MSVDIREGGTRLDVLAAVAVHERDRDEPPRQKHITERVSVSKGAVSTTCSSLVEEGLLGESDGHYTVNDEMLLVVYKEHLEAYLVPERTNGPFDEYVERHNEARRILKQELRHIVTNTDDERRGLLLAIIREALIASLDSREVQTHRDLLYATDHLVRMVANHVATSPSFEGQESPGWERIQPILLASVALNRGYDLLTKLEETNPFLGQYYPGTPAEKTILEQLNID